MKRTNDKILDLTGSRDILEQADLPSMVSDTVALTCRESLRLMELVENPVLRNGKFRKVMADYSEKAAYLPDGVTVIRDSEQGAAVDNRKKIDFAEKSPSTTTTNKPASCN